MTVPVERATRFRGEGRPKRRLSLSPPPAETPTKPPSSKKSASSKSKGNLTSSAKGSVAKRKASPPSSSHASDDEKLPTTYKNGQKFPTVKEMQPQDLPLRTYKSISESGILKTALEKSRQKWLTDTLFEKYWVKYSRKNKDEPTPSSQSMTKLNGDCFMVIEPHSFKVALFSVKTPGASHATASGSQSSSQSSLAFPLPSPLSHLTNHGTPPQPRSTSHVPFSSPPVASAVNGQHGPSPSPSSEIKPTLPTDISARPKQEHSQGSDGNQASPATELSKSKEPPAPQAPRQDNANNADPVIQMLAARAASDESLKSLMKIVAQGKATQEQLTNFQRHIDELNGIIQGQKRLATQGSNETGASALENSSLPPGSAPLVSLMAPPASHGQPLPSTPNTSSYAPRPTEYPVSAVKHETFTNFFHQTPPQPAAKAKATGTPKAILSAIVFEFVESSGTRYLLPRNSILEYLPGNTQVLMSFLVVRKGDSAAVGRYQEQKEYYQPVTVRLISENAKLLENLARVVAPPDEVRKYMADLMDKLDPAEDIHLATRLPRDEEDIANDEEMQVTPRTDEPQSHYEAPNSLLPLAASEP